MSARVVEGYECFAFKAVAIELATSPWPEALDQGGAGLPMGVGRQLCKNDRLARLPQYWLKNRTFAFRHSKKVRKFESSKVRFFGPLSGLRRFGVERRHFV